MTDNYSGVMEAEVRRLAEAYPDAIYQSASQPDGRTKCFYDRGETTDGPPGQVGCIIGQAAANAAKPFFDNVLQFGAEEAAISEFIDSWDNADFLITVQEAQDKGATWSEAVRRADEQVAENEWA